MHSSCNEYHWLLKPLWSALLRKQFFIKQLLILTILIHLIMRGNSQQMYIPILWTFHQNFLVEVKLLSAVILIQCI